MTPRWGDPIVPAAAVTHFRRTRRRGARKELSYLYASLTTVAAIGAADWLNLL